MDKNDLTFNRYSLRTTVEYALLNMKTELDDTCKNLAFISHVLSRPGYNRSISISIG